MNNDTIPFEDSIFINQEAKYVLSLLNDETKSSSWLLSNGIHKIGRLETKEIILERQDKGFIGYTPEELKDNLEKYLFHLIYYKWFICHATKDSFMLIGLNNLK